MQVASALLLNRSLRNKCNRSRGAEMEIFCSMECNEDMCHLTDKFAETGRYASEEENGEDIRQKSIFCPPIHPQPYLPLSVCLRSGDVMLLIAE
jgi:hypothetical protein